MPPPDLVSRYERKFLAYDYELGQILRIVESNSARFHPIFQPRYVNSVYFDTPDRSDARAHIRGAAVRGKVRVRWYGDRTGHIARPVLEVKSRQGVAGQKLNMPLAPLEFEGRWPNDRIEVPFDQPLPVNVRAYVAGLIPSAMIRYRRWYYRSSDGRFRMTVDAELGYFALDDHRITGVKAYEERRLIVIELKYDIADDDRVDRITTELPFRLDKFSKYVAAVQHLSGG